MKLKWFGHASFLITSEDGTRIITDPYTVGGPISYGPVTDAADAVTVSHEHGDHNNDKTIKGSPQIIKGEGAKKVKSIEVKGISSHHDANQGSQRGTNTIFRFTVDGINVCHLGDLGHPLSTGQIKDIGPVEILLIPVGGFFTIDAKQAAEVAKTLKPKVVVPMHFKTAKCAYPIAPLDDFLKDKSNIRRVNSSEVEFKKGKLPESEIIVLQHAL